MRRATLIGWIRCDGWCIVEIFGIGRVTDEYLMNPSLYTSAKLVKNTNANLVLEFQKMTTKPFIR